MFLLRVAEAGWLKFMIRRARQITLDLPLTLLLVVSHLFAQDVGLTSHHQAGEEPSASMFQSASERTGLLIGKILTSSYPELETTQIQARPFKSSADFFRTRPRIPDFFVKKNLRYVVLVNPRAYELKVPEDGVEAIIAHELSHIAYLKKRNRLRLLSMVRLLSESFAANFERRTDLEAISRGYGEGLRVYRNWLYQHIPQKSLAEKRRDYLSSEEIDAILLRIRRCPQLLDSWLKKPPRNLQEVHRQHMTICATR
jgi:hypothetical protein